MGRHWGWELGGAAAWGWGLGRVPQGAVCVHRVAIATAVAAALLAWLLAPCHALLPSPPPPTHPHTQPADCLPAPAAATQIYAAAAAALDALASRLAASNPKGPYFFGAQPSSIDAPLFAVLSFLKAAPTVHPDLR